MKRFAKEFYLKIFFIVCLSIITFEILNSISSRIEKNEKIIASSNVYSFWNVVKPSTETIEKIKTFENILPFEINETNLKYERNNNENYSKNEIAKKIKYIISKFIKKEV